MRCFLVLVWCVICSPSLILGFGVQLEGLIDLGPNWDYKYKLSPLSTTELFTELPMFSYSQKVRKDMDLPNVGTDNEKHQAITLSDILQFEKKIDLVNNLTTVTQTTSNHIDKIKKDVIKKSDVRNHKGQKFQQNSDKKLKRKRKRKNHSNGKSNVSNKDVSNGEKYIIRHENNNKDQRKIGRLSNFMKDVYKQSMKVWKKMLKTVRSGDFKSEVNTLKNYFKIKYRQFMEQFKKQRLKTKLGIQKFVFNAIETSERIMQRLVNSLSTYENSKNGGNIFQQIFDKHKKLLYAHACKKIGVCRANDDFGNYLIELINIILQTDNAKIKQAADALTEVIKTTDFTQTIDRSTQEELRKQMVNMELWDPLIVKSMFVILRNVLSHKNQPMVITTPIDKELSNKTVAFHEIIDIFNKNIYKSENITGRWIEIKKQLEEWRVGKRNEIQTAFQSLIELMKKGLEKIDTKVALEVDRNTNIILKPIYTHK